jgi:hypothetical protein
MSLRPSAIDFGNDHEAQRRYDRECKAARRSAALRGVHYVVAPRQRFVAPSGKVFEAESEIKLADLEGSIIGFRDENGTDRGQPIPAWRALRALVGRGVVLETDLPPEGPAAA